MVECWFQSALFVQMEFPCSAHSQADVLLQPRATVGKGLLRGMFFRERNSKRDMSDNFSLCFQRRLANAPPACLQLSKLAGPRPVPSDGGQGQAE